MTDIRRVRNAVSAAQSIFAYKMDLLSRTDFVVLKPLAPPMVCVKGEMEMFTGRRMVPAIEPHYQLKSTMIGYRTSDYPLQLEINTKKSKIFTS